MSGQSERLQQLLADETPIDPPMIAELLGVSLSTVRSWYSDPNSKSNTQMRERGWKRHTRLPKPDTGPNLPYRPVRGGPSPEWMTKTVVAWAIDPYLNGGRIYLDNEGNPIRRYRSDQ